MRFTIASGQTLSDAVSLNNLGYPSGFVIPTNWTAGTISFEASIDNVNFYPVYDAAGSLYTIQALVAGSHIILEKLIFESISHLKLKSSVSQTNTVVIISKDRKE
jgi:hypothetical protein